MKPLVSYLWRWSWIATVPLAIVFLHWIDQTWDRYWTFGIRYDSAPLKIGLLDTGEHEANHIINRSIFEIFGKGGRSSIGSNDLRLISLFINEDQLAKLNRNLPHSGFHATAAATAGDGFLGRWLPPPM